jgi:hypothetical protein
MVQHQQREVVEEFKAMQIVQISLKMWPIKVLETTQNFLKRLVNKELLSKII